MKSKAAVCYEAGKELVIETVDLTKSFGATAALGGVELSVAPGEIHALVGENGAGKSTLMKILSGVITDYQGRLLLRGAEMRFAHGGAFDMPAGAAAAPGTVPAGLIRRTRFP